MGIRIDGKQLAEVVFTDLEERVKALKEWGTTPTLAVVLVGFNPSSVAYVRQKQKAAERIGAKFILKEYPDSITQEQLLTNIDQLNTNDSIHGLIVQLPLGAHIDEQTISNSINPQKDVDGFLKDSAFDAPIANAAIKVLEYVYKEQPSYGFTFTQWMTSRKNVVMGRGKTAGTPIAKKLKEMRVPFNVVHRETDRKEVIINQADTIISCVGKGNILTKDQLKDHVVLVGVGLHMEDGKLKGDYEEDNVKDKASFYTPTPGGMGPLNVAHLWKNVVTSAEK